MYQEKQQLDVIKTILGRFDGQNMIGEDEVVYPISANYASKSRLVEGDTLKLYVYADGSMIYKQIRLAPRVRFIGVVQEVPGSLPILSNLDTEEQFKVLYASILFFKLRHGDRVAALVSGQDCKWAAIDTVIDRANDEKEIER